MKYLSGIDLVKNELKNARIHNLAGDPANPVEGQFYYNTSVHKAYIYNATSWVDITQTTLNGDQIVTAINASSSIIDDNNLSANVNDAITKRHSQNTDVGTSSATFYLTSTGVKLKNNGGNLDIRNNADSAYANITGANIAANGTLSITGNATIGSGANVHTIKSLKTSIVTSGKKADVGAETVNVFEILDSTATPNKLFEIRQNGDTIIAGVLTVNGTGTSTFAGNVSINGALNVAQGATVTADFAANNMTLTGNLIVEGNTTLGNEANTDTTTIVGLTTIKSAYLKDAVGAKDITVFKILDVANAEIFKVQQNGDTTIGGVLTVSGTGQSTFAGDVSIGGNLTVAGTTSGGTTVDLAEDLTVTGKLIVKGDTELGDNSAQDKLSVKAFTTIYSPVTKDSGSSTVNVFQVVDSTPTTPVPLFEVRQNGDTIIGGVLKVNGTGESTFAGDVSIGGRLTVAEGIAGGVSADLSGDDLTLTGNLVVQGNTLLGNEAGIDTTDIIGITTITSSTDKAAMDAAFNTWVAAHPTATQSEIDAWKATQTTNYIDVFKIKDSKSANLFQVKGNGDVTIGGILTVNGTGTSTFAGDVNIGGALTVKDGIVGGTSMALGEDLTVEGVLNVHGNTNLGNGPEDTLTVVGTVVLPADTTTIGAVAYSDLTNAKSKAHSQNTDTGTSNATFQIGTSGVKIKNVGGTELQVRNAGDTALADLRVGNLTVEGATTTIVSNTVSIGDSTIELNSDITAGSQNSDGGVIIKRLMADNSTRKDASIIFNNVSGKWQTTGGDVAGTLVTAQLANKVTAQIGDGTATSYVVTHNLNTRDLTIAVRESAGSYELVFPDVEFTSVNTITLRFGAAPTSNQYTVVIVG